MALLLAVLLSSTYTECSSNNTYCVSEHSNCSELVLHCDKCHPLMWYAQAHTVPDNSRIVFLQGIHTLNSSKLEFLNSSNVQLVGIGVEKLNHKSVVQCQGKDSGLEIQFSTGIHIRGLEFKDCWLYSHTFNAGIHVFHSFNVTIFESRVTNSYGYNLLIVCSGDFKISHSTIDNSNCTNKKCNDSANLYVELKTCFHQYKLVPIKFVVEHSKILYYVASMKLSARGIRFFIQQPMVTVVLQNVLVNGSSGDSGGNVQIHIFAFYRNPSKVIFRNCAIENGHSRKGGGVSLVFVGKKYNYHMTANSSPTLIVFQNTVFRGNTASGSGGALYSTFLAVPFS